MLQNPLYLRGLLGLLHKGRNAAIQQLRQGVHWFQPHVNEETVATPTRIHLPACEELSEDDSELELED